MEGSLLASQVWNGAEALRQHLVPIGEIQEMRGNARLGDVDELAASLRRWGQVRAVALQGDGRTLVAGHHLVKAARQLGWTHVAAIQAEFQSEGEARAYALADNRLVQVGGYDEVQQLSLLGELEGMDFSGTGYTLDDLENLRAAADAIPEIEGATGGGWGYSETAAEAAARGETLANSRPMKEVVMMVDPERYEQFGVHLRVLMGAYGTTGTVETILRAVETEAYRASQNQ